MEQHAIWYQNRGNAEVEFLSRGHYRGRELLERAKHHKASSSQIQRPQNILWDLKFLQKNRFSLESLPTLCLMDRCHFPALDPHLSRYGLKGPR